MHLLRQLVFVLGLATLFVSQPGFALGLGNSELHSALNQPFRADIQLTNLRGLSENEIIVRLASNTDFQRAGIERLEFYNQLQFEVRLDASNGPVVRVTSREPVREPYMNFLVEARWASGRLLREYTFLLDLPTFDDERQSSPVQAVTPSNEGQQRASRAAPSSGQSSASQQPSRAESGSTRSSGGNDTYRVNANDTLWEIALRARPGRDLSVQQTMLAIQRENPEAFINGNINLLREGQVLRLPDRDQILRENRQGAVREVAQQNREWSDKALGAQLDAGQRSGSAPREPSEMSGQVRLAASAQNGGSESGQSGGQSTDSGAELAGAREELDKSRRENRELAERVEELEAQIETMESLIEASNEQLRALQATARQSRDEQDQAEEQVASETRGDAGDQPSAESGSDTSEGNISEGNISEGDSAEGGAASEDRGKRVVRSAPAPKTLVDHVMDNLLWVGLGVLLLLILVLLAVRRRQSSSSDDANRDQFGGGDSDEPLDPAFSEEDYAAFQADQEAMEEGEEDVHATEEDELPDMDADEWDETVDEPQAEVEAETGDVVGEADIYIAYGKLDQAEELLLKALDKEPDSPAIRSKLLEIYAENRDVPAFDRHYAALLETGNRDAIQRASELRETIPGAGEFDVSALDTPNESGTSESAAVTLTHDDEHSEPGQNNEFDLGLDDDFDFDLDEESKPEASVTDEGAVKASSEADDFSFDEVDGSLDFTLDESDDNAVTLTEGDEEESDDFPELDLKLDDEDLAVTEGDDQRSAQNSEASELDDWEFDFEADTAEGDEDRLEALDSELSSLDDSSEVSGEPKAQADESDLEFSLEDDAEDELTLSDTDLDSAATTEDEQAAGSEGLADLDDEETFTENGSASQSDLEPEAGTSLEEESPAEGEEPLAEGDEPSAEGEPSAEEDNKPSAEVESDLDLDRLDMGDMDLSSLDEEMSDLDADLEEPDKQEAEPPTVEDDLSVQGGDPSEDILPEDYTQSESDLIDDDDMDAELDFLADADEAATKLDLARAYIDMGDTDGARDILEEVRQEGNEDQRKEADELLGRITT